MRRDPQLAEVKPLEFGERIVHDKAYALSSPQEYFAETTEAFFGKNDFEPFDRAELKRMDPAMDALLAKLWGAAH